MSDSTRYSLELFGASSVFLPIPKGQKGPRITGWQKLDFQATQTIEFQSLLKSAGNVGVLLGPVSGNLVDIDLDSEEAVKVFRKFNPDLLDKTLQTIGSRGRHFFFRIKGDYPQRICRLEPPGQEHIGEWRGGGGAQTVVSGTHPSGVLYRVVNAVKVTEIEFCDIQWPAGWMPPAIEEQEPEVVEFLARIHKGEVEAEGLSAMEIQSRENIIGSWCKRGDLGFIFGERGCGKTWLVAALACRTSEGKPLFEWGVERANNVLYIDGEMPLSDFRERLMGIFEAPAKTLRILHHEHFFNLGLGSLNLVDNIAQKALVLRCREVKIDLLIIDNLSCLFSGMLENDSDEWEQVLPWLLELRRMGVTVIIVHHAGRNGLMRGTSRREDSASWIIKVEKIMDGRDEEGKSARFSSTFTKQRSGDSCELSRKWFFKTDHNGAVEIACEEESFDTKILELFESGLDNQSDIAMELGVHKSTISRACQRLVKRKLLQKSGKSYKLPYLPGR